MESLEGGTCSFGVHDMSASPSLIANEGETSPSAPSALSASPEAGHAMHAELLRLREEVAHLRRRLANQPQGAHECEDGVPPKPIETESEFETPDKDRCTDSFPSPSEGLQVSFNEVRRSDWALRERAYRCARDFFMSPDGVTGAGRVVRAQLLSAMRQREPEVAAFFESPRQQFRCLLVEGDPEGIIEWDDFVNCYVRQCKQSISAAKAMEPERERSPATASTRSPVLPLQRCSEVSGRNATCFSEDVSPSRLQEPIRADTQKFGFRDMYLFCIGLSWMPPLKSFMQCMLWHTHLRLLFTDQFSSERAKRSYATAYRILLTFADTCYWVCLVLAKLVRFMDFDSFQYCCSLCYSGVYTMVCAEAVQ